MKSYPSPNHDERSGDTPVDMLVLHYTGMESAAAARTRMCDANGKVSAHYMIDEDGDILQLVPENRRAWHAGEAFWRGQTNINGRSIGIELVNPGHEFGLRPFPDAQMAALEALAAELLERHPIPAVNVVGHSDVAPRRKSDPGELFDWRRLAAVGIGLWPDGVAEVTVDARRATHMLAAIGYETVDLNITVEAFQRRYRPTRIDGIIDGETGGLLSRVQRLTEL
ncbi:MAG: N-acetylmuramoyl-L-alanine amidase [Rhodospirillaceae bacterium]|nr:N-acetylmuramoyl-L-alanine amidase [Rhodospirillaceae bacterium]